jgi:hypothetical protein
LRAGAASLKAISPDGDRHHCQRDPQDSHAIASAAVGGTIRRRCDWRPGRQVLFDVIGQPDGQRRDTECRIGDACGREYRTAGDIKPVHAEYLAIGVHDSARVAVRHSCGARVMKGVVTSGQLGTGLSSQSMACKVPRPRRLNSRPTLFVNVRSVCPVRLSSRQSIFTRRSPSASILSDSMTRLSGLGACSVKASR